MEYNIEGKISFAVNLDIEAENEEKALEVAKGKLKDYYHLNVVNAHHILGSIRIDLDAFTYDDDDEEVNEFDNIRCITFDKEAQDNLPEHIKAKMKADRDKARANKVFSLPECVFNYCPHPNECKIGGCLSKKTT